MSGLLKYEWRRLRSVPSTYLLLGAVILLSALTILNGRGLVASVHSATGQAAGHVLRSAQPSLADWVETFAPAQASAGLLFMIFGALAITGEYRDRMLAVLFLHSPGRIRVVLSKMLVTSALCALASATCAAVASAYFWGSGTWHLTHFHWQVAAQVGLAAARAVAAAGLYGVIGIGIGGITARLVPSVISALMWALIIEPLIQVTVGLRGTAWAYLLPIADAQGSIGVTGKSVLALCGAVVWAGLLLAAGCAAIRRRDVAGGLA